MKTINRYLPEMRQRFSVKRIGLFGSRARNEDTPSSDIDLLVEFEKNTFDNYMSLKEYLSGVLEMEVDLVLSDSLKPRIRESVLRETVYAKG